MNRTTGWVKRSDRCQGMDMWFRRGPRALENRRNREGGLERKYFSNTLAGNSGRVHFAGRAEFLIEPRADGIQIYGLSGPGKERSDGLRR